MTEVRSWSRGQGALRAGVLLGPLVAVLAAVPAGGTPSWWLMVLVAGLGAGFALYPDSAVGTGVLVVVLVWWAVGPSDPLHPAALVAAVGLLAAHLAGTVAAYAPGATPPEPATVRRWALRGLVVLPAALLTWAIAAAAVDRAEPPGLWAVGLAGVLVAILAADVLFDRSREA
jgi:hypothetical protein